MRARRRGVTRALPFAVLLSVLAPRPARATWSIVAVDPDTGLVGIALASCIAGGDIAATGGLLPGVGAVVAQASTNPEGRRAALEELAAGAAPERIVRDISSEAFDPQPLLSWTSGRATRQYGIVALAFRAAPASFTGDRTFAWAGAAAGDGVSVQGNLLRGGQVVDAALAAFRDAAACALPDRLLLALEAGASAGGDRRCVPELAALSAYLEVAWPDDPPQQSALRLVVNGSEDTTGVWRFLRQQWRPETGDGGESPLHALRADLLRWREGHPGALAACPIDPQGRVGAAPPPPVRVGPQSLAPGAPGGGSATRSAPAP